MPVHGAARWRMRARVIWRRAARSEPVAAAIGAMANAARLQERWSDAAELYAALDRATADWEPRRAAAFKANPGYVFALYNTGRVEKGIEAARAAVELRRAQY